MVDFGRELYIPWRIANGEVLYRELGGHFGPLAQYFDGLLFKICGPGLMVLVTANLVIFAIILLTFYLIARRAWGAVGAVAGTAVFIAVFGFSQLTRISNYTYAAPYSHETTHGMLVVLLLVAALLRWLEDPLPRWSLVAGLLFGLAALLKAEFVFAGGLLGMTTLVVRWRYAGPPRLSSIAAAIAGAVAPVLLCTIYFARFFPFTVAWKDANHGWLRFAMPGGVHAVSGVQAAFTGLDQVQSHLHDHLLAAAIAGGVIGAIALLVWISKRITKRFAFVALGEPDLTAATGAAADIHSRAAFSHGDQTSRTGELPARRGASPSRRPRAGDVDKDGVKRAHLSLRFLSSGNRRLHRSGDCRLRTRRMAEDNCA